MAFVSLSKDGCMQRGLLPEWLFYTKPASQSPSQVSPNSCSACDSLQSWNRCLTNCSPCICILSLSFNILTVIHGLMLSSDLISLFSLGSSRSSVTKVSCLGQTPTKHAFDAAFHFDNEQIIATEKHFYKHVCIIAVIFSCKQYEKMKKSCMKWYQKPY